MTLGSGLVRKAVNLFSRPASGLTHSQVDGEKQRGKRDGEEMLRTLRIIMLMSTFSLT